MIRNPELLRLRREFVKEKINRSKKMNVAVTSLSRRLFLSEATIIKDFYSFVNKESASR